MSCNNPNPSSVREASFLARSDPHPSRRTSRDQVRKSLPDLFKLLPALTQMDSVNRKISEEHDKVFATGCLNIDTSGPRANAAFVVLARNKELEGVVQSLKSIERHFNRWWHYPYVFLNDGDFDQEFKDTVVNYTSAPVEFGKIDSSMWGFPDWVDEEVAKEGIRKQGDQAIMYGGLESYHHMCRFYSG